MPQERDNPFPFPTAEECIAAPGTREQKAARNVIVRHITGIPRRGYLLGECDAAPIYRGVTDLTTACWALLDALDNEFGGKLDGFVPTADVLREILIHHGCPTAAEMSARKEMISDAGDTGTQ